MGHNMKTYHVLTVHDPKRSKDVHFIGDEARAKEVAAKWRLKGWINERWSTEERCIAECCCIPIW